MAGQSQTILPAEPPRRLHQGDYAVAIICPMGDELSPVLALLDETHENLDTVRDQNAYKLGKMGHHNVVVCGMPEIGNNVAAMVVTQLLNDFSQIRFGILVGIGGGIPDEDYEEDDLNDIRLGDVVVSHSRGARGGVIQFDRGKCTTDGFMVTGYQSKPPHVLAANVEILKASHNLHGNSIPRYLDEMLKRYPAMKEKYAAPGSYRDCVFEASYTHGGGKTCKKCDMSRTIERESRGTETPRIHYGTIGSSNAVIRDSRQRDELRDMGIICVEMEAAGLMEAFPCLVVRGICDYADSHKNKKWQPYAAATAAAYSKELLLQIPQGDVQRTQLVVDALGGLSMTVDRVDQRTKRIMEHTQSTADMRILEWLSWKDVNFSNLQNEFQQTHTAGTGQWLLDHRKYQDWRDHEPGVLWLHGVAGCGKTILCSTIIRDLQENFPHLAYWYFRFDNHILQDVSHMLRSIIRQLSVSPLPEEIRVLYDRHCQRGSEPSLEELITVLNCTIQSLAQDVYIVIDALDECPHQDNKGQRDLLVQCVKILRKTHPGLHLLVTSRPEPDLERELRSVANCDFDVEKLMRSDVERFVKVTLEDHRLASWTEDVKAQIMAKLLEFEERRFRWADLQIKRFAQCPNIEQLRKAMNSVPKDLEAAYRQAFDAIDEENSAHVAKIMMWLAVALEPLGAEQIAAVAGFRDPDYILQICSTLLVTIIDEDTSRIIKLAHFSVKEFLVPKLYENSTQWYRFTMEHANKSIALFALRRLMHQDHLYQDRQLKKILPYNARYWPQHAIEGLKHDDPRELDEQICLFFSSNFRGPFLGWLNVYNPDYISGLGSIRAAGPLYYACLLGLQSVVSKICDDGSKLSRGEGRYGSALNAAAISGHVAIVGWILRNCHGSAGFLDFVRVAREINANVTECIVEICNGLADLVITEDVVRAAAENENNGQQVMKALLENRGDEVRITESIVSAASGNWESGPEVIELLLKQRGDEVQITEGVVEAAFENKYSGRQVLKVILENFGKEARMTENVFKAAKRNGERGQQVMEMMLGKVEKENETHFAEGITSLVTGNLDAPILGSFWEKGRDEISTTETTIKAAAESHLYGPQMMEMLLEAKNDIVQLTEEVVVAAARNSTSGQKVLEVLLRKATFKYPVTDSVTCIIAERFDACAMELLLMKNPGEIHLTEGVLKSVASNGDNGEQVLNMILSKKKEKVGHITEPVVRAAARNHRSGTRVMELILSERAYTMQITEKIFLLVCCHWSGARLMKLLSESIEDDVIEERLASATNVRNMAAVEALQKRLEPATVRLDLAIARGDTEAAELLLKNVSRYKNQRLGFDSLRRAAAHGFTGIVELLLKKSVDQTASDLGGLTPLMCASEFGHIDTIEVLLAHGADLTMKDRDGRTALSIASISGRLQAVTTLLQRGADHSVRDNYGSTPLMLASGRGLLSIVDLLLMNGADYIMENIRGKRALDLAAHHGHLEVVNLLLRTGASPRTSDLDGCTPLISASDQGYSDIAELLLKHGADLTSRNKWGETALHHAASKGHMKVINLLLQNGADLTIANNRGDTALHSASINGHLEVSHLLIENGAGLALKNRCGWTALDMSLSMIPYEVNVRLVEFLLRSGANPATTDVNGRTALHHAAHYGHAGLVDMLIEHGADIRSADKSGCTPLHVAARIGHTKVVEIISSRDSSVLHERDASGFTAVELAAKMEHVEIVRLLIEKSTGLMSWYKTRANQELRLSPATREDVYELEAFPESHVRDVYSVFSQLVDVDSD